MCEGNYQHMAQIIINANHIYNLLEITNPEKEVPKTCQAIKRAIAIIFTTKSVKKYQTYLPHLTVPGE